MVVSENVEQFLQTDVYVAKTVIWEQLTQDLRSPFRCQKQLCRSSILIFQYLNMYNMNGVMY